MTRESRAKLLLVLVAMLSLAACQKSAATQALDRIEGLLDGLEASGGGETSEVLARAIAEIDTIQGELEDRAYSLTDRERQRAELLLGRTLRVLQALFLPSAEEAIPGP